MTQKASNNTDPIKNPQGGTLRPFWKVGLDRFKLWWSTRATIARTVISDFFFRVIGRMFWTPDDSEPATTPFKHTDSLLLHSNSDNESTTSKPAQHNVTTARHKAPLVDKQQSYFWMDKEKSTTSHDKLSNIHEPGLSASLRGSDLISESIGPSASLAYKRPPSLSDNVLIDKHLDVNNAFDSLFAPDILKKISSTHLAEADMEQMLVKMEHYTRIALLNLKKLGHDNDISILQDIHSDSSINDTNIQDIAEATDAAIREFMMKTNTHPASTGTTAIKYVLTNAELMNLKDSLEYQDRLHINKSIMMDKYTSEIQGAYTTKASTKIKMASHIESLKYAHKIEQLRIRLYKLRLKTIIKGNYMSASAFSEEIRTDMMAQKLNAAIHQEQQAMKQHSKLSALDIKTEELKEMQQDRHVHPSRLKQLSTSLANQYTEAHYNKSFHQCSTKEQKHVIKQLNLPLQLPLSDALSHSRKGIPSYNKRTRRSHPRSKHAHNTLSTHTKSKGHHIRSKTVPGKNRDPRYNRTSI